MSQESGPSTRSNEKSVTIDVEVRYAETDQMGVVHHANYVVWFELARTRLCRLTGHHYSDIERGGHLLMVTGVECRYLRSALYGDTVQIQCHLAKMGSRNLRFEYRVSREGQELARGATDHLWVKKDTGRPCRVPEDLAEAFQSLVNTV